MRIRVYDRTTRMGGIILASVLAGCSSVTAGSGCVAEFPGEACLDMSAAESLLDHQGVIEAEVGRTLEAVRPLIDIRRVRVSIVAGAAGVIPEVGLGGFNPDAGEVRIFADPRTPDLDAVLRAELMPMLAHELHHLARRRTVGYGSTLLQAVVTEGLADHFSLEVTTREPPPWTMALTEEELATWIPEVIARDTGPYEHDRWFFGTTASVPRWTGYSVGFELVRQYLETHPDARPSSLVGEPEISFVPAAF